MATLSVTFKKAIEKYSGYKVKTIKVHPDPQVPGTYAIRTKNVIDSENQDWMICHYNSNWSLNELVNNIEECEYASWPPVSGNLKFF